MVNSIYDPNEDLNYKPKNKKCGIYYEFGIGTLTKNPNRVTKHDLDCYSHKQWLWYDGYWYLVKKSFTSKDLNEGIYSKEQFINFLISLI